VGAHRSDLAHAFADRLRVVYGDELGRAARIVHVAAVANAGDGHLPVLAVGGQAPSSPTDAFALDAARARTDAIVTTGRILRTERKLSHVLTPAAAAWRREVLAEPDPPWTVVLTRRPEDVAEHPLFDSAAGRAVLLTSGARAPRLHHPIVKHLGTAGADTLPEAIALLERELGVRSVLIEAGPSTARGLYVGDGCVDELLLSRYEGPALSPEALVGEFATAAEIERCLGAPVHTYAGIGPDSRWRFLRHLRGP
jgi:riboflavin biosynthesis pyrimidine reductase